ncbi:MAG: DNA-deoxyinosine glycosylase [Elusimicrobia bacterium]|nr:DNA-deoxyinosine glycosylase [Elusimicrobiota bacterium]
MKIGFPAVAGKGATVLILGTMPGAESLRKGEYYGHSRNAFWFIMGRVLNKETAGLSYTAKKEMLKADKIALWDVIKACERKGSLDTSIIAESIVINDFAAFYSAHRSIRRVFFNGAHAETEYRKRVLPLLPDSFKGMKYTRLPSTSPAMATLTRECKLAAWSAIINPKIAVKVGPLRRISTAIFGRLKDKG